MVSRELILHQQYDNLHPCIHSRSIWHQEFEYERDANGTTVWTTATNDKKSTLRTYNSSKNNKGDTWFTFVDGRCSNMLQLANPSEIALTENTNVYRSKTKRCSKNITICSSQINLDRSTVGMTVQIQNCGDTNIECTSDPTCPDDDL